MNQPEFTQLFTKYIRKGLSASELISLRKLLKQTDDDSLCKILHHKWESETHLRKPTNEEVNRMLTTIRNKTQPTPKHSLKWLRFAVATAAAAVLLLVGFSGYLYLDRGQLIELAQNEIVIKTEVGQRTQVTLPDGSTVHLNSESQLCYAQTFGLNDRTVKLTGEGYFNVQKNPKKQFIVCASDVKVKVLGTTFNARAYANMNEIEVTLVSGSVELTTHTNPVQTVYLKPNNKGVFNKQNGMLTVQSSENGIETAWMANKLVFRSTSLKEIFNKVQRRYGVQINVNRDTLLSDIFTGTFDIESIEEVMHTLQKHYGFTYQIKGDNIQVTFAY